MYALIFLYEVFWVSGALIYNRYCCTKYLIRTCIFICRTITALQLYLPQRKLLNYIFTISPLFKTSSSFEWEHIHTHAEREGERESWRERESRSQFSRRKLMKLSGCFLLRILYVLVNSCMRRECTKIKIQ